MLKMRKGFTLIELLIVVVIIGILGRDRDPEVREHEVEGVHHGDEVGPSQPGHRGRGVLRRQLEVHEHDSTQLKFQSSTGVNAPTIATGAGYWTATVDHTQLAGLHRAASASTRRTRWLATAAAEGEPACK